MTPHRSTPEAVAPLWVRVLRWAVRLPQRVLMLLVRGYRLLLKPWLGNACRFEPTCSAYTLEALQRHGALGGSALGGWRLLRCHPWCNGGHDPVPENLPRPTAGLFTRLGLNSDAPLAEDRPSTPSPTRKTP
ncbi:membrane protein insertion efficiency factor YidD [Rubrivivax rivuli]|uniref:Putative membrane protein insertion efficiency factor n=1 Tax=Rubrivivax rivuli TaxID=1862385 RepID=A0A437RRZ1_9BURK|nr:membrane protein insertion efficiency factor YidD [Rubrivivax rivuli]